MHGAILIISSTRCHVDMQEILRIQDTAHALLNQGWSVDVLVPRISILLTAALHPAVRIFTIPRVPFFSKPPARASVRRFWVATLMFLRSLVLMAHRNYSFLHGFNDGALIVRALDRVTPRPYPYVAEFHTPFAGHYPHRRFGMRLARALEKASFRHASAVIIPDERTLAQFDSNLSRARVCLIPDPHIELTDEEWTLTEFSQALMRVYAYLLLPRPDKS